MTALTCGRNTALLAKQIAAFCPQLAVTERREDALALAAQFPQVTFLHGREGLIAAATADCDMVMNALMGMRGLEPTYHAILAGKDIGTRQQGDAGGGRAADYGGGSQKRRAAAARWTASTARFFSA